MNFLLKTTLFYDIQYDFVVLKKVFIYNVEFAFSLVNLFLGILYISFLLRMKFLYLCFLIDYWFYIRKPWFFKYVNVVSGGVFISLNYLISWNSFLDGSPVFFREKNIACQQNGKSLSLSPSSLPYPSLFSICVPPVYYSYWLVNSSSLLSSLGNSVKIRLVSLLLIPGKNIYLN